MAVCERERQSTFQSNLAPRLTLLKPLACLYHSFTEFNVDFLDRSNMNRMATASLQTSGNMLTNSRWPSFGILTQQSRHLPDITRDKPPKSQIENVIVVRRTDIVFSMKLTPEKERTLCQGLTCSTWLKGNAGDPPRVWM